MRQIRLCFILMSLMLALGVGAKELQVASMVATQDVMSVAMQRNDLNGNPCALVNVMLPMQGCEFAGNIIGDVEFKVNKYRVYLSTNTKFLQVDCPGYTSLRLTFSDFGIDHVESKRIYNLNFVLADEVAAQQPVLFKITPTRASIMVDNKLEYEVENGQLTVNLPEGDHSYVATADGYRMSSNIFNVKNGQNKVLIELDPKSAPVANNTQAATASLSPMEFEVKGVKFKMMPVEGGTFQMGATGKLKKNAQDNEKPVHKVTLSDYMLGETEVTQALWKAVMDTNPSKFPSKFQADNWPVEMVTWEDCQEFISKLNSLTGKDFRLPSEAEWEYAAKGGKKKHGYLFSGSNDIWDVARYEGKAGTYPVKSRQANELGLYDMSGNVWEWCSDWYDAYPSTSQTNPTGPSEPTTSDSRRVTRGGSWVSMALECRVSFRNFWYSPTSRDNSLGLRLALDIQP